MPACGTMGNNFVSGSIGLRSGLKSKPFLICPSSLGTEIVLHGYHDQGVSLEIEPEGVYIFYSVDDDR